MCPRVVVCCSFVHRALLTAGFLLRKRLLILWIICVTELQSPDCSSTAVV